MARTLDEVISSLPPDHAREIETAAARLIKEELALRAVRRSREPARRRVAETQTAVHYTLSHDQAKDRWELRRDGSSRPVATFASKAEALKRGILEHAMAKAGGSVRIQSRSGVFQEVRTYPRSRGPRESRG